MRHECALIRRPSGTPHRPAYWQHSVAAGGVAPAEAFAGQQLEELLGHLLERLANAPPGARSGASVRDDSQREVQRLANAWCGAMQRELVVLYPPCTANAQQNLGHTSNGVTVLTARQHAMRAEHGLKLVEDGSAPRGTPPVVHRASAHQLDGHGSTTARRHGRLLESDQPRAPGRVAPRHA